MADCLCHGSRSAAAPPADSLRCGRSNRGGAQSFTNRVQATQATPEGHGMMLGWRSITGGPSGPRRRPVAGPLAPELEQRPPTAGVGR
ncbi:hypothetical protein DLJ49_14580 [Rhodovulum sp. 12E13]|nr:hypothetical protein DLJ49_14580 [Rhodovulum sp. 12E13]